LTENFFWPKFFCQFLFILGVLCAPNPVVASPSSALSEYQAGKYDRALKEYERLLEKRGEDPRLHFNAGAAAYRAKLFHEAVNQFTKAIDSPDLLLQQRAYYNLGNTHFQLGLLTKEKDPNNTIEQWEKAIKSFDLSLKLASEDKDAAFNRDAAKKQLEDFKKALENSQGGGADGGTNSPAEFAGKAARAAAEDLVRQRRYLEALQIMEQAVSTNKVAEEKYGDFMKRLREVSDAQSTNH
jgi:tetratricopeptide (TPR) repeat protein